MEIYPISASVLDFMLPVKLQVAWCQCSSVPAAAEGRLMLCGFGGLWCHSASVLLKNLKQQINSFRYGEGKWWWQRTGWVVFGGWDQSHELVGFSQHWSLAGLQQDLKQSSIFVWVYGHAQTLNIFSLKSIVSFQTWAVWAVFVLAVLAILPGLSEWIVISNVTNSCLSLLA